MSTRKLYFIIMTNARFSNFFSFSFYSSSLDQVRIRHIWWFVISFPKGRSRGRESLISRFMHSLGKSVINITKWMPIVPQCQTCVPARERVSRFRVEDEKIFSLSFSLPSAKNDSSSTQLDKLFRVERERTKFLFIIVLNCFHGF